MPLVRFDVLKGKSESQIASMLDAAHRAIVRSFGVPERDRYQIVQEHEKSHVRLEDTGLGIQRTDDVVVVNVVSRPRSEEAKIRFYQDLVEELSSNCGIAPSDVIVSFTINSDADWSFGHGRAQFLTGDL